MYRADGKLLWDFWTAQRDGVTYLFHLQAPRDLPDPEMRHGRASVGAAASRDLRHWESLGTVFEPGAPGSWDDRAIWTGSVLTLDDGAYAMLYTGTAKSEDGKVQRIGLARSTDLRHWERHNNNPLIEADMRWYMGANPLHHDEVAWRDPWLMRDPAGDGYLALITAQSRAAPPDRSGCVALARSPDLVTWTVEPPIAAPDLALHMEVPQLRRFDGRWCLLFSAYSQWIPEDAGLPRISGTFYLTSDRHDGGFRYGGVIAGEDGTGEYAARLVGHGGGDYCLSWLGYGADGQFAGVLGDPHPVRFDAASDRLVPVTTFHGLRR